MYLIVIKIILNNKLTKGEIFLKKDSDTNLKITAKSMFSFI